MIRRSLNVRPLIIFAVCGAVLSAGIFALHRWQLSRTAKGLLALANAKEKEGDLIKAADYLDRYLRIRGDDGAVKSRLALTYGKAAKDQPEYRQPAIDLYYRALTTNDEREQLALRSDLAELLLDLERFEEAEREATKVLALEAKQLPAGAANNPGRGLRVLALAQTSQFINGALAGQDLSALKLLSATETARQAYPADVDLAKRVAILYREFPLLVQAEWPTMTEVERRQKADECLDRLVSDNSNNPKAYLARFGYRSRYSLPDGASDLAAALQLGPQQVEVQLAAAEDALLQAGRVAQAKGEPTVVQELALRSRGHFEEVIKLAGNRIVPRAWLGLGRARLAANEIDQAILAWRDGLTRLSQSRLPITELLEFHALIAEAGIDADRLSDAQQELNDIDQLLVKLTGVTREQKLLLTRQQDLRRAKWHVQKGEPALALPLLSQVITSHGPGAGNLQATLMAHCLRGNTLASLGEWREAALSYDEAARLQPTSQPMRLLAASTWLAAGRPDEASKQAESALVIASTPEAAFSLAVAQLQWQSSQVPTQRHWKRLEQALETLESIRNQWSTATPWQLDLLRVDYLLVRSRGEGRPSEGIQQAKQVLAATEGRFTNVLQFWPQICLTYQLLKLPQDADRALAEYRRVGASSVESALVECRLATLREEFDRAKALLTQTLPKATTQQQAHVRAEMLRTALAAQDLQTARNLLMAEHQQNPQSLLTLCRLADVDLQRKDYKSAQAWEDKLRGAGGRGQHFASYYGAWRTFLSAASPGAPELPAALDSIERVVQAQPNWTEAIALKAMLQHRLGRLEQALADYETAVQLGERRLVVYEQLIALLDQLNRTTEVDRYLAQLEAQVPVSQRLTEMASSREVQRERPAAGLEIARKSAAQKPQDARAQLWLARMLMVNELNAEAEETYLKAIELSPSNPQMWNSLLAFYSRGEHAGQIAALATRLDESRVLAPTQKSLLLGQAHELLGNRDVAKTHYSAAASTVGDDLAARLRIAQFYIQSDPEQAKEQLEAALQIDPKSVAAKRLLAVAHAAQGDLPAAEALLSVAAKGGMAEADDVRLRVLLLAQKGGQSNLARAVALLEEVVSRPSGVQAVDRLLLAGLYERQAAIADLAQAAQVIRDRAAEQLLVLAAAPQPDPTHLAALVQFFHRQGRADEAAKWLAALHTRVEALASQNEAATAIALLIQAQILTKSVSGAEPWLQKLEAVDKVPLRSIALRAQVTLLRDPQADVETLIEPKLAALLATAKSAQEKERVQQVAGDIYMALKRHAAAEKWYRLLVATAPQQYPVLVAALTAQGKVRDAIELCQKSEAVDPTVRPALTMATVLLNGKPTQQDHDLAEPLLAGAIKKFPGDANLANSLAVVRTLQKRGQDSIELFRKVVQLNPRSTVALNNLAMLLADRPQDREEALRLIDEAIAIAGKDPGLLDTKGAILVYAGRSGEAVQLLESATRDPQADPRHHFHLALAYRDQGKAEQAKVHLQTALNRQLTTQVMTLTDQRLLTDLRAALQL